MPHNEHIVASFHLILLLFVMYLSICFRVASLVLGSVTILELPRSQKRRLDSKSKRNTAQRNCVHISLKIWYRLIDRDYRGSPIPTDIVHCRAKVVSHIHMDWHIDPWEMWLQPYINNFQTHIEDRYLERTAHVKPLSGECRILIDEKFPLVKVMVSCLRTTSHCLSQCCPNLCRHMASLGHKGF